MKRCFQFAAFLIAAILCIQPAAADVLCLTQSQAQMAMAECCTHEMGGAAASAIAMAKMPSACAPRNCCSAAPAKSQAPATVQNTAPVQDSWACGATIAGQIFERVASATFTPWRSDAAHDLYLRLKTFRI